MELKYVIPNMAKTFGNLEYAGEGNIEYPASSALEKRILIWPCIS